MTDRQACISFQHSLIHGKLSTLIDVGLGYITLSKCDALFWGEDAREIDLELLSETTGRSVY